MKNQLIKNEYQAILFNLIQRELPAKYALVDVISDLLGISTDAAYRRIRGAKSIDFEEAIKLCKNFRISMDTLTDIVVDKNYIRCSYSPLNMKDTQDYLTFIQVMSDNVESISLTPNSEIILATVDIPLFNLFSYKELTFFKLFSWNKTVYGYSSDFVTFAKEMDAIESLNSLHEKTVRNYQLSPSTEIWTNNTIEPILRLISYHSEMMHFNDKAIPVLLCEQLLDLMNTFQKWAEKGTKGSKEIPFKFFVSETDIANTFVLFKKHERTSCLVKLYTINGLSISDELFCQETESWLRNSAQRATLISQASEKERFKFFESQKQKIRLMLDKIYQLN